jgi:hypothetical protein
LRFHRRHTVRTTYLLLFDFHVWELVFIFCSFMIYLSMCRYDVFLY